MAEQITVSMSIWSEKWVDFWWELNRIAEFGAREAEIVADTARRGIAENFEYERAPDGTPWEPLAPMTREVRAEGIDHRGVPFRVGEAHPILVRTRDLKLSFTDPSHPRNVTEYKRWPFRTHIALSAEDDPRTPDRIATLHSGGVARSLGLGGIVERVVPARPFVGLSRRAWSRVDEQIRRILSQRVKRLENVERVHD